MRRKSLILIFLISLGNLVYCQQGPLSWKTNSSFFPIAVWMQNPNNAAAYKAMGINIFVGGNLDQQKLDLLKKSGMKVIANMNNFGLEHLKDSVIYGWAQEDEPDNAQFRKDGRGYEPCIDPAVIVRKYQEIKSKDPDRPVYLNLGMGVSYINWHGRGSCSGRHDMYKVSRNGYLMGCDIASFDIYPVNTNDKYLKDKLWFVPKGIDSLRSWSNDEKPVWCWIESTRITEDCPRKPTPAEVKTQVWMALIHGAGGFGYFCQSFYPAYNEASLLKDPVMVIAIKEINAQVTSLARELNSPATKGYASVTSSNSAVPIDLLTKNYKDNNYIFSVAMRPGKTTAEFQVKSGKKVEVLGENRSIKIKKGKFSDEFSGYGVHLYKIK